MLFSDVVGQEHITSTLQHALEQHRVAHAYLFSGQRGCGKTTTARIFAKALNCLQPNNHEPDNICDVCKEINDGTGLDVIEIDGASNRNIDDIRKLRETVRFGAARGKYKVYIIDEVHMLTKDSFNALLKTLEEPPEHVVFIFATTEIHKMPMTILSRCQRFDFRRITLEEIVNRLRYIAGEEKITIDEESLLIIARKADGSLRDSQSMFDQVRAFCGDAIKKEDVLRALNVFDQATFFRVTDLIKNKDTAGGIGLIDEITKNGHDLREFISGLAEHFRNMLVINASHSTALIESSDTYKKRYEADAKLFSENDLLRLLKITHDLEQALRWVPQPRYKVETTIIQMIRMESSASLTDLIQRLDNLNPERSGEPISSTPAPKPFAVEGERSVPRMDSGRIQVMGQVEAGLSPAFSKVTYTHTNSQPPSTLQHVSEARPGSVPSISSSGSVGDYYVKSTTMEPMTIELKWNSMVEEIRRSKVNLGTILRASKVVGIENDELRIACPDDYHSDGIRRNREYIADAWKKITQMSLRIVPIQPSPEAGRSLSGQLRSLESGIPFTDAIFSPDELRILSTLRIELGAEPVQ
jgi:DNA polymerase-3 subunit gamma/tau